MSTPRIEEDTPPADQERVEEIVRRGPAGAFAVAGVATALVVVMFIAFYIVVYLPRGAVQ